MPVITFTPKQAEVLKHRMEVPDCIAEVWGPDNDNHFPGTSGEEVLTIVTHLLAYIFSTTPDGRFIAAYDPDNEHHVRLMNELVDGNTMAGIVSDMLDHAKGDPVYNEGLGWANAMRAIDRKYEQAGLDGRFNI